MNNDHATVQLFPIDFGLDRLERSLTGFVLFFVLLYLFQIDLR
jgi:hypothetical protein